MDGSTSLPPYQVRRSSRARRARLVYHPRSGLTVVLPRRYDAGRVPELVSANLAWLRRTEARLGSVGAPDPGRDGPFPERLSLRAIGEEWTVRYLPGQAGGRPTVAVRPSRDCRGGELTVSGADGPPSSLVPLLGTFVAGRAREALVPAVGRLAGELGEHLAGVTIRAQRSRWGSCSSRRTISLNRNLLFLPEDLARLVLLHEVCHLRELSHSPRFWALLCELEPRARALSQQLRLAWQHVPDWADPSGDSLAGSAQA